jgi:hypothetical protein
VNERRPRDEKASAGATAADRPAETQTTAAATGAAADVPAESPAPPPDPPQEAAADTSDLPDELAPPEEAATGDAVAAGPDPLAQFAPFIDLASPPEEVEAPAPAGSSGDAETKAVRPKPRDVDVEARLADEIEAIEVAGAPLDELLQMTSDYSTIPITIEPWALAHAKIDASAPVTLKLTRATVAELLTAALSPLGLSYSVDGEQLIVGPPAPSGDLREVSYNVADLTAGQAEEIAGLASLAQDLVAVETWEKSGGKGVLRLAERALVVRQSEAAHFELLRFLEKLRLARGLTTQSDYDERVFALATPRAQAAAKLATPIALNYVGPTRLVEVLNRLEEEAGLQILVNWRAAASEGWNPEAESMLSVAGEPLSDALDKLLAPMNLAWRAIDGQTLEVTSLADYRSLPMLEFFPLRDAGLADATPADLIARIQTALGADLFAGERPLGALRIDPKSGYLLASLPQPQQLQLEKLLADWGKKD